jgi:hypothetical protein
MPQPTRNTEELKQLSSPNAYGYPYSLEGYLRLPLELKARLVDPSLYGHQVARRMVS